MENTFTVLLNEEQINYLQKLSLELDTKIFLIEHMFANHKDDSDASLLESVPFKQYYDEYEKAYIEWTLVKEEFQNNFMKPLVKKKTGLENPNFSWSINFRDEECIVTVEE